MNHLLQLLQGLLASAVQTELLLISVPVGSSSLHPALNAKPNGLSVEAIDPLLSALGYRSLCSSGDGQFQLLQQQGAFASKADAKQPGRLIPAMRLSSLYGDPIMP